MPMNRHPLVMFAAVLAATPLLAAAEPACRAISGTLTRPLVELYTSEGCDSCPPADRWLSATFAGGRAAAVPLAFHVDYWDRLGWKDRFATAAYTSRQQQSADANGATFVYTPQVLLQGRDQRWSDARVGERLVAAAAAPARALLDVTATPAGRTVQVRATAQVADAALRSGAVINLAFVDSGLVSDVKAGENRGVKLRHDHVVRAFATGGGADARGALLAEATFELPAERGSMPEIVAFVQRTGDGDVLQALPLSLADCLPRQGL